MRESALLKRLRPPNRVQSAAQQAGPNTSEPNAQTPLTSQGQAVKCRRVFAASRRIPTPYRVQPRRGRASTSAPRTEPMSLPSPTFCDKCCAKKFAFETKHFCCDDGRIRLASNQWPTELKRLYTSFEEDALHFQKYARIYNNLFAFSSIAGGIDATTKKVLLTWTAVCGTLESQKGK